MELLALAILTVFCNLYKQLFLEGSQIEEQENVNAITGNSFYRYHNVSSKGDNKVSNTRFSHGQYSYPRSLRWKTPVGASDFILISPELITYTALVTATTTLGPVNNTEQFLSFREAVFPTEIVTSEILIAILHQF